MVNKEPNYFLQNTQQKGDTNIFAKAVVMIRAVISLLCLHDHTDPQEVSLTFLICTDTYKREALFHIEI